MWISGARVVIGACLLLLFQSPSIRFDGARNAFLLENWTDAAQLTPERYAEVFSVSVDIPDIPPMLGQYRVERGALVFTPQFPVQAGVRYRAVARIPGVAPVTSVVEIHRSLSKFRIGDVACRVFFCEIRNHCRILTR